MNSLVQSEGNTEALRRIDSLQASASGQWGKMNAAQMLAHCQKPHLLALGELTMKRGLIGKLFGGWAKKKFVDSEAPFGKNSPTDPTFRIQDTREFEDEKRKLADLVRRFGNEGVLTKDPHPFFGSLTPEEWDRLLWKHLDHHLRQFGA